MQGSSNLGRLTVLVGSLLLAGALQMCELLESCKSSLTQENELYCTLVTYSKPKSYARSSLKPTRLTCKTV